MRHSCGYILVRESPGGVYEYLLQCRRDTIPYLVFLQGRHDGSLEKIETLWKGMTVEEHRRLRSRPFRELFRSARIHPDCWETGQRMYQRTLVHWANLDETDGWDTPEWGFPKGRKNRSSESNEACAIRELMEETGLCAMDIRPLDAIPPIRERFQGTDQKWYTCDYYVAETDVDPTVLPPSPDDPEVSALGWFTFEAAIARFRPWEHYRRETLERVHEFLKNAKNDAHNKSVP